MHCPPPHALKVVHEQHSGLWERVLWLVSGAGGAPEELAEHTKPRLFARGHSYLSLLLANRPTSKESAGRGRWQGKVWSYLVPVDATRSSSVFSPTLKINPHFFW